MKENLIILSGWGIEDFVWQPLVNLLVPQFEIEIVGWNDVSTLESFKEKVLNVIEKKQIKQCSMIGWSLGSVAALDLAATHSILIKKMILFSATAKFVQDFDYKIGWHERIVNRMIKKLKQDTEDTINQFNKQLFSTSELKEGYYKCFIKDLKNAIPTLSIQDLVLGLEYLVDKDVREKLLQIKTPILLIHGQKDITVPIEAGIYLNQQLTESKFVTLEEVGHMPFYCKVQVCYNLLNDFLTCKEGNIND